MSEPTEEPLSIVEARRALRIADNSLDHELADAIAAARQWVEQIANRTFRTSVTREVGFSEWPCFPLRFDWPPLLGITSVAYADTNGSPASIDSSNYRTLVARDTYGLLEVDSDFSLPVHDTRAEAVTIRYTTGFSALTEIPPLAKQAMKLWLQVEYEELSPLTERHTRERLDDVIFALSPGYYR